jgi:cation diffusion facilitator CzcD-associated flavoprotein CzcO
VQVSNYNRNSKTQPSEIFDKANEIGGTWSKNTYPNLSCDIPSQVRPVLKASPSQISLDAIADFELRV